MKASAGALPVYDDTLYMIPRRNSPYGEIVSFDLRVSGAAVPNVVLPPGKLPVEAIQTAKDALMEAPFGLLKLASRAGGDDANHGPIRDSWPTAFFGYPRGHRVGMETWCWRTRGLTFPWILTVEPNVAGTKPSHDRRERWIGSAGDA